MDKALEVWRDNCFLNGYRPTDKPKFSHVTFLCLCVIDADRPDNTIISSQSKEKGKDMTKMAQSIIKKIQEENIKMVDFRMVDIYGELRHVTIPANRFSAEVLKDGIGFDASNYGYAVVENSDMVFIPDPDTAYVDPFCEIPTLAMSGNVMIIDPLMNRPLPQYPRNIVKAAEAYLRKMGIADKMMILPEFEFYVFDNVKWEVSHDAIGFQVDTKQAHWNSGQFDSGTTVALQGNYHISKPQDVTYELRSEMCMLLENIGIAIHYHHPEVGSAGQYEIEPKLGEMSDMADATINIKYVVRNVARKHGKIATFMPKPVYGEAGSSMHVHLLLLKEGKSVFYDEKGYAQLSRTAHYFMGGILKHISSLCAFTNPSTNSYKRLVPGFEAPVTVGYATSNRSAAIRIPSYVKEPDLRRFELRSPDGTSNPYFCFAAILMAGLDGVKNEIDPQKHGWGPFDVNLFDLPQEELDKLEHLPTSLDLALDALETDHSYLTEGGVFPQELIDNWIKIKRKEASEISAIPSAIEFSKYFNC